MHGVTQLDNVLYVVCYESPVIKTYTADTLSPLGKGIQVDSMKNPTDIVVCRDDRQLYVADWYCIWRVSADDHLYVRWLGTEPTATPRHTYRPTTDLMSVYTLSVASRRLLVTSWSWPNILREYSTTDRQLLRVVQLPGYMQCLYHAVVTTCGTFVVCHCGTPQDKEQYRYAVSEIRCYTAMHI